MSKKTLSAESIETTVDDFSAFSSLPDNFRVSKDGSLKKRDGYVKRMSLPGTPESFNYAGKSITEAAYFSLDDSIYFIDLENDCVSTLTESSPDAAVRNATVLPYRDHCLLFDGISAKVLQYGTAKDIRGYVPLCAKDWSCENGGTIYEERNLVSTHYRASYVLNGVPSKIVLPYYTDSIDRIVVNGETISDDEYELDDSGYAILCYLFTHDAGKLTVYASFSPYVNEGEPALSCRCAVQNDGRIFVYGSSYEEGYLSYGCYSETVGEDRIDPLTIELFGVNSDLYFRSSSYFRVGNESDITSILPISDKAIVFTENSAWRLDPETKSVALINAHVGAVSPNCAIMCGDRAVSMCRNGLYLWDTKERDGELRAECLSASLDKSVRERFLRLGSELVFNAQKNELWIFSKSSSAALIYSFDTGLFSVFSGFDADNAFFFGGNIYFTSGDTLCVFTESTEYDSPDGESKLPITASVTTDAFDFKHPFSQKKLSRISLSLSAECSDLCAELETDTGNTASYTFSSGNNTALPRVVCRRTPPYRFYSARLHITDRSPGSSSLHAISLRAKLLKN